MFGTSGIRGPVGDAVTADLALNVGRAVATDGAETVVIGRDARDSGRFLLDAAAAGCRECGADVIDLGLAATPTLARSIARLDADAGIVITASHNPPEDNGLKLWTPSGQAFDTDRRERVTEIIESEAYAYARGTNQAHDVPTITETRPTRLRSVTRSATRRSRQWKVLQPSSMSATALAVSPPAPSLISACRSRRSTLSRTARSPGGRANRPRRR
jgi:Phosphomannomutase